MKNLSQPDVTKADTLYDDVIARKRNKDFIKRLSKYESYIKGRYITYKTNLMTLENINKSIIVVDDDKEAIHSSFTSSFKKNIKDSELKQVYDECKGTCPFCGTSKLEEVDHYIPKEHYPEFTLYPLNLIPICNKCNKQKGDKFLDGANVRKFINFYADDVDDIEFLKVDIDFNSSDIEKSTKIKYIADFSKIQDVYVRQIVENHYRELNLLERYGDAAGDEISNLSLIVSNQEDENEAEIKNAVERTVIGGKNGQLKRAGKNDWKYLLYEKILAINYIDALVKFYLNKVSD